MLVRIPLSSLWIWGPSRHLQRVVHWVCLPCRGDCVRVIFLTGPTASGKTDLALAIVRRFPCEIISVDSAMVYRGMDIGTAKPNPAILSQVPHRLIDICDPADPYSAARFRVDALREIEEVQRSGRLPLLTGGTMLYFRALQQGLSELPAADGALRARLEREADELGWPALHARLVELDPEAAARIHPNDPQRIQRALEVCELTGRPLSELQRSRGTEPMPFDAVKLHVLPTDRADLHKRIESRFHRMLDEGLLAEVEALYARGDLDPAMPALRAVGYRQLWQYLDGELDYRQAAQAAITATRQLARRQMTWMRAERGAEVFAADDARLEDRVLKYMRAVTHYQS